MSQNESMIAEAIDRILADAKTGSASADAGTLFLTGRAAGETS
jgi:hypothetical protein